MASISAGESDEEVDRVLMFQAAVQGYAPLLLERSSRNTLQDFIDACFAVLKNVKQDSTLPEKLRDSNRLLEWIKVCVQFNMIMFVSEIENQISSNCPNIFFVTARLAKIERLRNLTKFGLQFRKRKYIHDEVYF